MKYIADHFVADAADMSRIADALNQAEVEQEPSQADK